MRIFRLRTLWLASLLGLALTCSLAVRALAQNNPIQIKQCFITEKALSKNASGTQIVYVNRSAKDVKSVVFVVGYRNAAGHYLRKVQDDGDFGPGVVINHHFALYSDVTYAGKETTSCSVFTVKWADGTVWTR